MINRPYTIAIWQHQRPGIWKERQGRPKAVVSGQALLAALSQEQKGTGNAWEDVHLRMSHKQAARHVHAPVSIRRLLPDGHENSLEPHADDRVAVGLQGEAHVQQGRAGVGLSRLQAHMLDPDALQAAEERMSCMGRQACKWHAWTSAAGLIPPCAGMHEPARAWSCCFQHPPTAIAGSMSERCWQAC